MRLTTFLSFLTITASTALAGVSIVHNKCGFDVWVTSVGVTSSNTTKLPSGNYWNEKQYREGDGVGTAIKITRTEKGLWDGSSVLTFAYSYDKGTSIYYDLSSFSGFAFWGKKLRIHGPEGKAVEEVVWNGEPRPNRTLVFFGDTDLILELCD